MPSNTEEIVWKNAALISFQHTSLTIRKLPCKHEKICQNITRQSYMISNEPENKITWQIRWVVFQERGTPRTG